MSAPPDDSDDDMVDEVVSRTESQFVGMKLPPKAAQQDAEVPKLKL